MGTGLNYRQRRQVMQDESGFSDDGLFSDDEYKPPVSYLRRRRDAVCVTSTSADRETPVGAAHVLNFLNARGLPLPVMKSKSEEEDLGISSDDDDLYFRRVSEELKKNVSVQVSPQYPYSSPELERYPAAKRGKLLKYGDFRMPEFLKSQPKGKVVAEAPPSLPSSVKDTSTAIGKMSLLPN